MVKRSLLRHRYLPNAQEVRHAVGCVVVLVAAWWLWDLAELGLTWLTDPDELSPWHAPQSASAASDQELIGQATVIDGDTVEIHGERIRILDIDAPETRQACTAADGAQWRCGQKASLALADWIGPRTVTCEPTKKDRYGRWLARCSVGGADMAAWLAEQGWVVPYRDCKCEVVRDAAARAKARGAGIWSGDFQMPWEWRKAN
jgi:endonuclease YncB( thermonuclease family)